jgi:hypothetical protein
MMGNLYISEFPSLPYAGNQLVVAPPLELAYDQAAVTFSASVANSQPTQASTRFVLLNTDSACSIAIGAGNADATKARMGAGETRFYGAGPGLVISVIQNT